MGQPAQSTFTGDHLTRAMAGVFRALELWGASPKDAQAILGFPPERTYYAWRAGKVGAVPHDTVRRMGYILGIYKDLQLLYNEASQADTWLKRANRHFAGQTPLQRMAGGDVTDLAAVHTYLDAYRGTWS
jgi:Protein of unknown function (DUF2384)